MTKTEITEADRVAAADACEMLYSPAKITSMREGAADNYGMVQAFARHRAQAFAEVLAAREAEICPTCDSNLKTISRACYELQLHLSQVIKERDEALVAISARNAEVERLREALRKIARAALQETR